MLNTIYFVIIMLLLGALAFPSLAPTATRRSGDTPAAVAVAAARPVTVEAPESSQLDAIYRRRAAELNQEFETMRANAGMSIRRPLE